MLTILPFSTSPSIKEEQSTNNQDFKYLIDEFADAKIMRFKVEGWDELCLKQKEYIYHLSEAAKWGRDILFDQNFKFNLEIRKALEQMILAYNRNVGADGSEDDQEYQDFLVYAKRVFFSNGIHHHYGEEKFTPNCSKDFFRSLMLQSDINKNRIEELIHVIFDTKCYNYKKYTGTQEDLLLASCVNFYDGVSKKEAEDFYASQEVENNPRPISYGLNSKLVRNDGIIREERYKIGGLYSDTLKEIVFHLEKAQIVAENDHQKHYISKLIEYYHTGCLKVWDEYNISWVKDTESMVDFVNGFIENYGDPMGMKATWESVVNFRDIEASKRTKIISENAQWFEDNSPVDPKFKKDEVKGVSAKVITVTTLGGDCYPTAPIGINLPNADWIRKEHGSKSVTIANLSEAYEKAAQESPKSMLNEFSFNQEEIELIKTYGSLTGQLHTDLHECLGHGSGQLLATTSPNALLEISSSLEEARADLFALYYLADKKMIELGIVPNDIAFKAEYINYIKNGLFTQFVRIELGKDVTQAHMQARKLIAEWAYEAGRSENIIELVKKDGRTYILINDYEKLRSLFGQLLAEIQRIKSEGDYKAGKELISKYATVINPDLHKEVKERYASLNLKPYGGFINPDIVPFMEDGAVIDYKIEYKDSFVEQMLDYGINYSK